ncbi:hypothetical protein FGB62_451g00 [Gracilaria domingensis]|nr:hypothetical protein FGB62_451g00 [Gracilaria domingensis]
MGRTARRHFSVLRESQDALKEDVETLLGKYMGTPVEDVSQIPSDSDWDSCESSELSRAASHSYGSSFSDCSSHSSSDTLGYNPSLTGDWRPESEALLTTNVEHELHTADALRIHGLPWRVPHLRMMLPEIRILLRLQCHAVKCCSPWRILRRKLPSLMRIYRFHLRYLTLNLWKYSPGDTVRCQHRCWNLRKWHSRAYLNRGPRRRSTELIGMVFRQPSRQGTPHHAEKYRHTTWLVFRMRFAVAIAGRVSRFSPDSLVDDARVLPGDSHVHHCTSSASSQFVIAANAGLVLNAPDGDTTHRFARDVGTQTLVKSALQATSGAVMPRCWESPAEPLHEPSLEEADCTTAWRSLDHQMEVALDCTELGPRMAPISAHGGQLQRAQCTVAQPTSSCSAPSRRENVLNLAERDTDDHHGDSMASRSRVIHARDSSVNISTVTLGQFAIGMASGRTTRNYEFCHTPSRDVSRTAVESPEQLVSIPSQGMERRFQTLEPCRDGYSTQHAIAERDLQDEVYARQRRMVSLLKANISHIVEHS